MALKFGSSDVSALKLGSQAVSAVYLGADQADTGGGGGGLPEAPSGFAYILNKDSKYIVNASGDYILGKT